MSENDNNNPNDAPGLGGGGAELIQLKEYKKELQRLLITHLDGTYEHEGHICHCPIGELLAQLIEMVKSNPGLED